MNERAEPSGISLNSVDAAIVKGMLSRGDRQHDIAAWFGVNGGRVADIKTGKTFPEVKPVRAAGPGVAATVVYRTVMTGAQFSESASDEAKFEKKDVSFAQILISCLNLIRGAINRK